MDRSEQLPSSYAPLADHTAVQRMLRSCTLGELTLYMVFLLSNSNVLRRVLDLISSKRSLIA